MRPLCSAGTAHCWLTVHIVEYFDCRITSAFLVVGGWHAPLGVSVVDGGGETPGPIPNPEAKPARADGTALGRVWESRLPPTQKIGDNFIFVCAPRPRGWWDHVLIRTALCGRGASSCVRSRVGGAWPAETRNLPPGSSRCQLPSVTGINGGGSADPRGVRTWR